MGELDIDWNYIWIICLLYISVSEWIFFLRNISIIIYRMRIDSFHDLIIHEIHGWLKSLLQWIRNSGGETSRLLKIILFLVKIFL